MAFNLGRIRLELGDTLRRSEIHAEVGGQSQYGIVTPSKFPVILIFSGIAGKTYGYSLHDNWLDDGTFDFTGEGQVGDQVFLRGNKALRDSQSNEKTIHLFQSKGSQVTYRGELELSPVPYQLRLAPDVNGNSRRVIVFNFTPVSGRAHFGSTLPNSVEPIDVWMSEDWKDLDWSEYQVNAPYNDQAVARNRVEFELTQDYVDWLKTKGHTVKQVSGLSEGIRLHPDLDIEDQGVVVEAKRSSSRGHMRTAIGQVLDYKYSMTKNGKARKARILVPAAPTEDILELCTELEIDVVCRDGTGFRSLNQN